MDWNEWARVFASGETHVAEHFAEGGVFCDPGYAVDSPLGRFRPLWAGLRVPPE
jgi:hypothetical protein